MDSHREKERIFEPILKRVQSIELGFSDDEIALLTFLWEHTGRNYDELANFFKEGKTIRYGDNNEVMQISDEKKSKMLDFVKLCEELEAACIGVFPIIQKQVIAKKYKQQNEKIPIENLAADDFITILIYLLEDKDSQFISSLQEKIIQLSGLTENIFGQKIIIVALSHLQSATESLSRTDVFAKTTSTDADVEKFQKAIAREALQISREDLVKIGTELITKVDNLKEEEKILDTLIALTPDQSASHQRLVEQRSHARQKLAEKAVKEETVYNLRQACEDYQADIENYLEKYFKKHKKTKVFYDTYFTESYGLSTLNTPSLRERCLAISEEIKKPNSGVATYAKQDKKFAHYIEQYQSVVTLKSTLEQKPKSSPKQPSELLHAFKKEFHKQNPTFSKAADSITTKFVKLIKKLLHTDLKLKDVKVSDLWKTKGDHFVEDVEQTLRKGESALLPNKKP